jgi:hypothetical protein
VVLFFPGEKKTRPTRSKALFGGGGLFVVVEVHGEPTHRARVVVVLNEPLFHAPCMKRVRARKSTKRIQGLQTHGAFLYLRPVLGDKLNEEEEIVVVVGATTP